MKNKSHSLVGVIMVSKSDWKTMIHCCDTLKKFGVKPIARKVKISDIKKDIILAIIATNK